MAVSKKLEIIYHNGRPDGIRSIRRHLSTMTTYIIPRPLLAEAKQLTGINRPGIYYLISENDDNKIAQIYVGQTRKHKRVRFGKEAQRHERTLTFVKKVGASDMALTLTCNIQANRCRFDFR